MSQKIRTQTDTSIIEISVPDKIPQYYADGVNHIAIGVPVSKMVFYTTSAMPQDGEKESEITVEQRRVDFEVSIPTSALLEMAKHVIKNLILNKDSIDDGLNEYKEAFKKSLSAFQPVIKNSKD